MRISALTLLTRLSSFNVVDETDKVLHAQPEKYTELIKEQLYKGEDASGKKMKGYRDKRYAKMKNRMNPLPGLGTPDLKLKGDLYNKMGIETSFRKVIVISDVPYFNMQVALRGEKTVQLQTGNKNVYRRETLYPALRQALANITGVELKRS